MNTLRVLIIHDEEKTRARLRRLLSQEPGIDLVGELANTINAAPFIRKHQPQLVFLEIPLKNEHAVITLERLSKAAPLLIVFVSAFHEYAVGAFEASALDYLLEPFTDDRFRRTLNRARERLRKHQIIAYSERLAHLLQDLRDTEQPLRTPAEPALASYEERLVVKTGNRLIFLDADEVDWIEAKGVYVCLHVGATSYLLRESLQNVEARLDAQQFIRIHRSTIVNASRIKEIVPDPNGGGIVHLRDGIKLKLSRGYRNRVNASLG